MSELLLGTLIGGLIGVLPSLVTLFVNVWVEHSRQKHEKELTRIKLYEEPRIEAIQAYAQAAGALLSEELSDRFTPDQYFSAYERACLFVSADTRRIMTRCNETIIAGWTTDSRIENLTSDDKVTSYSLRDLNNALASELASHVDGSRDTPHRDASKGSKQNA